MKYTIKNLYDFDTMERKALVRLVEAIDSQLGNMERNESCDNEGIVYLINDRKDLIMDILDIDKRNMPKPIINDDLIKKEEFVKNAKIVNIALAVKNNEKFDN